MLFLSVFAIAFLAQVSLSKSQTIGFNSQFNTVVRDVQLADLSGATPDQMHALVRQLNSVLQMENQLNNLPSEDTTMRIQLSDQINGTLALIDAQATQAAASASTRTSMSHLIAYSCAPIAAAFGTIVYYYVVSLWRKYRIKRLFRMKVALR